jgi:hypothetical protein
MPVIPILMVNSQKMLIIEIKLPPAFGADEAVDFK